MKTTSIEVRTTIPKHSEHSLTSSLEEVFAIGKLSAGGVQSVGDVFILPVTDEEELVLRLKKLLHISRLALETKDLHPSLQKALEVVSLTLSDERVNHTEGYREVCVDRARNNNTVDPGSDIEDAIYAQNAKIMNLEELHDFEDVLDELQDLLDKLWNTTYPQWKMELIFSNISDSLGTTLKLHLKDVDLLEDPNALTNLFEESNMSAFLKRGFKQCVGFELKELGLKDVFQALLKCSWYDVKCVSSVQWEASIANFTGKISDAEAAAAVKLKSTLAQLNRVNYVEMSQNLLQYLPLLHRDQIAELLWLSFGTEEAKGKHFRILKSSLCCLRGLHPVGGGLEFDELYEIIEELLFDQAAWSELVFETLDLVRSMVSDWEMWEHGQSFALSMKRLLQSPDDWQDVFKFLKEKGQELATLPQDLRIPGAIIHIGSFKNSIEEEIQCAFDMTVHALKLNIECRNQAVIDFSDSAATQIALAQEENAILKRVTGTDMNQANMLQKWDNLQFHLSSYNQKVKDLELALQNSYKDRKQSLASRRAQLKLTLHDMLAKLPAVQVFEDALDLEDCLHTIKDDLNHLCTNTTELLLTLQITNISDNLDLERRELSEICELVTNEMQDLNLILDFNGTLKKLCEEEQSQEKLSQWLDESLVRPWTAKLDLAQPSFLVSLVRKKVNCFKALSSLLQIIGGEAWLDEHWQALFQSLGVDSQVRRQNSGLSKGYVIQYAEEMMKHEMEIRDISAQVAKEAPVRKALAEVELWAATAVFCFDEKLSSSKINVSLVKDWADLLASVSDNVTLAQLIKDAKSPKYSQQGVIVEAASYSRPKHFFLQTSTTAM
ncbi:Cytoplasmic dynein 2 heavy chain 1 [Gonapodya sp. JEL0774]|nr:Cytoplasmic dynein 2 heavy chain 1 [Gonapodya sp. JEL0774]